MKKSNKLLVQIKEISEFTGISETTLKNMVEVVGFPAVKLNGTWYSNTDAIEDWMYDNCYPVSRRKKAVNRK